MRSSLCTHFRQGAYNACCSEISSLSSFFLKIKLGSGVFRILRLLQTSYVAPFFFFSVVHFYFYCFVLWLWMTSPNLYFNIISVFFKKNFLAWNIIMPTTLWLLAMLWTFLNHKTPIEHVCYISSQYHSWICSTHPARPRWLFVRVLTIDISLQLSHLL